MNRLDDAQLFKLRLWIALSLLIIGPLTWEREKLINIGAIEPTELLFIFAWYTAAIPYLSIWLLVFMRRGWTRLYQHLVLSICAGAVCFYSIVGLTQGLDTLPTVFMNSWSLLIFGWVLVGFLFWFAVYSPIEYFLGIDR